MGLEAVGMFYIMKVLGLVKKDGNSKICVCISANMGNTQSYIHVLGSSQSYMHMFGHQESYICIKKAYSFIFVHYYSMY